MLILDVSKYVFLIFHFCEGTEILELQNKFKDCKNFFQNLRIYYGSNLNRGAVFINIHYFFPEVA